MDSRGIGKPFDMTQLKKSYTPSEILETKASMGDFGCIYRIYDPSTDKSYIGQTHSFFSRMKAHIHCIKRGRGLSFHSQISDYSQLQFEPLITYIELGVNHWTKKIRAVTERKYIALYNSIVPNGYNLEERNGYVKSYAK